MNGRRLGRALSLVVLLAGCGGETSVEIIGAPTAVVTAPMTAPTTATLRATATRTPTHQATATLVATATFTVAATATAVAAPSSTPTATTTPPANSPTPTATMTATLRVTATRTPTHQATATLVATATFTVAATATAVAAPSSTPTATTTPPAISPTPTATGPTGAMCGNGFLEPGETCGSCAVDCDVQPCGPTAPTRTFRIDLTPPPFQDPSSVTILIGYRSDLVTLPGSGTAPAARIRQRPSGATVTVNDLDYALRVVVSRAGGLTTGRLFLADFDSCTSAAGPTVADFACTVEGCASSFGPIDDCGCAVVNP